MTTDGPAVAIIANPAKASWRAAVAAVSRECSAAPRILKTTIEDPGAELARRAVAAGAARVIACGGDGTVREVAAGLAGTGIPLGVVPIGTANIFARNLAIRPHALAASARRSVHHAASPIDLGWAQIETAQGQRRRLPFLVLVGIGHDAGTVLGTRALVKAHLGWLAYFESGARHLLHRPQAMEVALDDDPYRMVEAWSVLAANCPRVPPGIRVFPGAHPDSGQLESLVAAVRHPGQWVGVAAQGLRLPFRSGALRYAACSRLRVRPSRPLPVQVDGDAVPEVLALEVTIDPAAVLVAADLPRPD